MHPSTILICVGVLHIYSADGCSSSEMQCTTGDQCIPVGWRCDGVNDCYDDSDEENCHPCRSRPCKNGATCDEHLDRYTCRCTKRFTGPTCERLVEYCKSDPCSNGGTCFEIPSGYRCHCPTGYSRSDCQTDFCRPGRCLNGGSCFEIPSGFRCRCVTGFKGTNCETGVDTCKSNPCQHGGSCDRQRSGYRCRCRPGITGKQCETVINTACVSRPCINGGTCIAPSFGLYRCLCTSDYTGKRCETRRTTCSANQFHCGDGTCISEYWKCDGTRDCESGIDEKCGEACGIRTISGFQGLSEMIINGKRAERGEFPWQAAVYINRQYQCSGALVAEKYILTTAACIWNDSYSSNQIPASLIRVGLGSLQITDTPSNANTFSIETTYIGTHYTHQPPYLKDFAVLELSRPVAVSHTIRSICLPLRDWPDADIQECYFTGWGVLRRQTGPEFLVPEMLHKTKVRLLNMKECHRRMGLSTFDSYEQICVEATTSGVQNCYADFGGPLSCRSSNGTWTIRGMFSVMLKDCEPGPNIYTNVKHFVPAILKLMSSS